MKKLVMLTAMLVLVQSACAKSLNGNVDATFTTENGDVVLTLVNKQSNTPVTVTEIDLLVPQKNKKDAQRVALFSGTTSVTSNTKISLGNVEKLVSVLYPSVTQDQIRAASPIVSDNQSATCTNCKQVINGIGFHLSFVYGGGTTQNILTSSFLHLMDGG